MHMTSDRRPWITDLGPRTADIGQLGSTAEFLLITIRVLCRGNLFPNSCPKQLEGSTRGSKEWSRSAAGVNGQGHDKVQKPVPGKKPGPTQK